MIATNVYEDYFHLFKNASLHHDGYICSIFGLCHSQSWINYNL